MNYLDRMSSEKLELSERIARLEQFISLVIDPKKELTEDDKLLKIQLETMKAYHNTLSERYEHAKKAQKEAHTATKDTNPTDNTPEGVIIADILDTARKMGLNKVLNMNTGKTMELSELEGYLRKELKQTEEPKKACGCVEGLNYVLEALKKRPVSRSNNIAITKIEEAILWLNKKD